MKHGLDHIPPKKRQELARAVQVLTDSFNAATSRRMAGHLKNGKILKIILYGSYARATGCWTPWVSIFRISTCWSWSITTT